MYGCNVNEAKTISESMAEVYLKERLFPYLMSQKVQSSSIVDVSNTVRSYVRPIWFPLLHCFRYPANVMGEFEILHPTQIPRKFEFVECHQN